MPSEQRVRRNDRRDLAQGLTAQPVGSRSKLPPVVIGESEAPPTQLPPQESILFDQVRQHVPVLPVQPAGDREQQDLEGRDVDHVRQLTSDADLPLPTREAEAWDTTRVANALD